MRKLGILIEITLAVLLVAGESIGMAGEGVSLEIRPFESAEQIIKEPEKICKYEDVEAACDQLLVYLYRKNDRIKIPTKDQIVGLEEVIAIIKGNGGKIVGQIPSLAMIQIEIRPEEKLLYLKNLLKQSAYVQSVSFNVTSQFIKAR